MSAVALKHDSVRFTFLGTRFRTIFDKQWIVYIFHRILSFMIFRGPWVGHHWFRVYHCRPYYNRSCFSTCFSTTRFRRTPVHNLSPHPTPTQKCFTRYSDCSCVVFLYWIFVEISVYVKKKVDVSARTSSRRDTLTNIR